MDSIPLKRCTKCTIEKPEEAFEFIPSRGYRRSECRECKSKANKEYLAKRRLNPPQQTSDTKQCNRCHEVKMLSEFSPNGPGYFYAFCKTCNNKRNAAKHEVKRIAENRTWYQSFTNEQGITVKGCSRCRQIKPLSEFYSYYNKAQSRCKVCKSEEQRVHRERNLEKYREQSRAYTRQHKEEARTRQRLWYIANKEYCANRSREYRSKHYQEIIAHDRERNQKEERKQSLRVSWQRRYQQNPGKHIDRIHRYRARMYNAPRIERINRKSIIERDKWTCYLCGIVCTRNNVTLDHVIPLFQGGTHTSDNLRVACRSCNCKKGHKILPKFLA